MIWSHLRTTCRYFCQLARPQVLVAVALIPTFVWSSAAHADIELSQAQRDWIAEHPVIRVVSDAQLAPLEYVSEGKLKGLSSDYLELISHRTGLRFEFSQAANWKAAQHAIVARQADMLVNAMPDRLTPEALDAVDLSRPYLVAQSVVFTKPDHPSVWDMADLAGKRVSARTGGQYAEVLQRRYPDIKVIPAASALEAFDLMRTGGTDAAMGTALTFLPFITRKRDSELYISRPEVEMVMTAQFATRKDWPELHHVIESALSSVSAGDESRMRQEWLREEDFGAPTLASVLRYNGPWVAATTALFVALILTTRWALRSRRTAIVGERVKARFLATMSHEIRTPINAVLGAIELLSIQTLNNQQRKLLETAEAAAEALSGLLDNVLDLSKLDEGKMRLEKVPVEIRGLIKGVAAIFDSEVESRGLTMKTVLPDRDTWAVLDPIRLRQVLMNLISNATKFTDEGGITIEANLASTSDGHSLHVVVNDTGCGIPKEQQPHVFDPYIQANGGFARRESGTGLGLAITRDLVQLMGGLIELHSEPGDGTTISIQLPVELSAEANVPDQSKADTLLADLRVLVVDDHAPNRIVLTEQLSQLGIRADVVGSGGDALRYLEQAQHLPNVILMDCFMPDMDGYQACTAIRASRIDGVARLPVVAISAATDAAHLSRCSASGMSGVLRKPIRLTELRSMLLQQIGAFSRIADLKDDIAGDPNTINEIGRMLQADVDALVEALRSSPDCIVFYAHRLHGAAGLIGQTELSNLARDVEANPLEDREVRAKRLVELRRSLGAPG